MSVKVFKELEKKAGKNWVLNKLHAVNWKGNEG